MQVIMVTAIAALWIVDLHQKAGLLEFVIIEISLRKIMNIAITM